MTSNDQRSTIRVGAMAPPLHEQLGVPAELLNHQQQDIDALIRLRVRGVLAPSVARKGEERVIKEVVRVVERHRQGLEAPAMNLEKRRWPIEEAEPVATSLVKLLSPYCQAIVIAGSIRRRKAQVGDIELLCVSRVTIPQDMFGGLATSQHTLDVALEDMTREGDLLQRRLNKAGRPTFGPSNKLLIHVPTGIPVDVFSASKRNWGMAMVLRTGPREFNVRMMTRFLELGMKGHAYGGVTDRNGNEVSCQNEHEVFRILGWEYLSPEDRDEGKAYE